MAWILHCSHPVVADPRCFGCFEDTAVSPHAGSERAPVKLVCLVVLETKLAHRAIQVLFGSEDALFVPCFFAILLTQMHIAHRLKAGQLVSKSDAVVLDSLRVVSKELQVPARFYVTLTLLRSAVCLSITATMVAFWAVDRCRPREPSSVNQPSTASTRTWIC